MPRWWHSLRQAEHPRLPEADASALIEHFGDAAYSAARTASAPNKPLPDDPGRPVTWSSSGSKASIPRRKSPCRPLPGNDTARLGHVRPARSHARPTAGSDGLQQRHDQPRAVGAQAIGKDRDALAVQPTAAVRRQLVHGVKDGIVQVEPGVLERVQKPAAALTQTRAERTLISRKTWLSPA